jgi:hypothetical protein
MKKIILLVAFAMSLSSYVFGQTYYYEADEYVDEDTGVKSKQDGGMYITFTNNSCYISDKNGYKIGGYNGEVHEYKGTKNGMLVYEYGIKGYTQSGSFNNYFGAPVGPTYDPMHASYFSSDRSRMNSVPLKYYGSSKYRITYTRSTPPSGIDAPQKLY